MAGKNSPAAAAALAEAGRIHSQEELAEMVERGEASRCAVVTDPPGAELEIDGNRTGITPFAMVLIRHGDAPRVLVIKKPGYETVERKVFPDGKTIPVQIKRRKPNAEFSGLDSGDSVPHSLSKTDLGGVPSPPGFF